MYVLNIKGGKAKRFNLHIKKFVKIVLQRMNNQYCYSIVIITKKKQPKKTKDLREYN